MGNGGRQEAHSPLSGKKESVLGPGASELERTQSVRGRDESEEGKERLGLATLLH